MRCLGASNVQSSAVRPHLALAIVAFASACLLLLTVALPGTASAAPKFPELTGRIVDQLGILTAADRAEIEETLRALDAKSSDQIVVVTLRSLDGYAIEDYGYQLGRHWKIGQVGTNNGVLLIVAPNDRKVRIEVGRGLEPQLTDTLSKLIIDNAILPAFRRGDFTGGIKAGVRDIRDVLLGDAEAVKLRAKSLRKRTDSVTDITPLLFFMIWVAIVAFIVWKQHQQSKGLPARARRRYGDGNVIVVPGGWGGSGGWSGGSSGGGFSGGGGDFGGGGSSGSW